MKKIALAITSLVTLAFAACNSSEQKTTAPVTDSSTSTPVTETPAKPEFKPFDVVEINHTVKDYAKWKPLFDSDSTARKESGLNFIVIGRKNDNPNDLMIVLEVSDMAKAKAFAADPRLKEVMDKAGVSSKPDIVYYHAIRHNPDAKEKKWVTITHRVKDFDAWLKAYDAEGLATRNSFGLNDAALARGIDDPNIVHIVFDIKDMDKAKARLNSPELKKLMMDAGVEGTPKIIFYTSAD